MKERYDGDDGRRRLLDALKAQRLILGDENLSTQFADACSLLDIAVGQELIREGESDNDLYLIVSGDFAVLAKGRHVATRSAANHVGEIALVAPGSRRTATVKATTPAVVAKVSEASFVAIADKSPILWRRIALELTERLTQRNNLIRAPNNKPHVFIGGSKEGLEIATGLQAGLQYENASVRVWTDGVFGASKFSLEALESELLASDLAVLVATPDDFVQTRGETHVCPRDNVIFELGLFMGALTRTRTFLVVPRGTRIRFPSDLDGWTPLAFSADTSVDLVVRLAPTCTELKKLIKTLGPR